MDTDGASDDLVSFVLDGETYFARWHPDEQALDTVVVSESGRWAFQALADCRAAWPSWQPELEESHPTNYDAVILWLAGRTLGVPTEALLNAWNLAGDVARGVGAPWHDRGRLRDRIFDKLTYASVPFLIGREQYAPRWSSRELVVARRMAADAVALLRAAL